MSIASEITRLQTAKSDLKTSIENKGVTVPSATTLDGYSALVDLISIGREYETGTYTPTVDIVQPTISFTGSHLNRPIFVGLVDAEDSVASTDSILHWFMFSFVDFSNYVWTTASTKWYARTQHGYKTSSSAGYSGYNISSQTGSTTASLPYYLSNTAFKPYAGNAYYFRSTRSYKWIAVW